MGHPGKLDTPTEMNGLEVYPAAFTDGRNPTKLGTRSNRRIQHQATGQSKQHCDRYRLAGRQAGLAADSDIPATVAKVPWRQITKHRKQDRKLHHYNSSMEHLIFPNWINTGPKAYTRTDSENGASLRETGRIWRQSCKLSRCQNYKYTSILPKSYLSLK